MAEFRRLRDGTDRQFERGRRHPADLAVTAAAILMYTGVGACHRHDHQESGVPTEPDITTHHRREWIPTRMARISGQRAMSRSSVIGLRMPRPASYIDPRQAVRLCGLLQWVVGGIVRLDLPGADAVIVLTPGP
jgi:hypothetical protein